MLTKKWVITTTMIAFFIQAQFCLVSGVACAQNNVTQTQCINKHTLSPRVQVGGDVLKGFFAEDTSLEKIKEHMFSVTRMQNSRTVDAVYRINSQEDFFSAKTLSIIDGAQSMNDCAVLDIGAGKGTFLKGMVKKARKLNGWVQTIRIAGVIFDFHAFEINENKQSIQALQDEAIGNDDQDFMDLEWTFGDTAEQLPQDWENKFTFIFATRSLEYCRDPLHAIEEVYRVLKPGGQAVISMSLINEKEYNSMMDYLKSQDESQRRETIGHVFFDGVNLAEEIQRLQQDHDIELFATSERTYQSIKVDKPLMQKFMNSEVFPFDHFVIVVNKKQAGQNLQFDYVLKNAVDPMRRIYVSKEQLLLNAINKVMVSNQGLTEQSI